MITLRAFLFTMFAFSCATHLAAMENEQSINDLLDYYANIVTQHSKGPTISFELENQLDNKIIEILNKNFYNFNIRQKSVANEESSRNSQEVLGDVYKDMIKNLQANWVAVEDYRMHAEAFYEEWAVFYKYGGLLADEGQLICRLAQKFGFNQSVSCNIYPDAKYLYVKKEILDRFKSVFKFSNF